MYEQQRRGESVSVQTKAANGVCNLVLMQIIQSSDDSEPLSFEVGAGEVMGNKMFQVAEMKACLNDTQQLLIGQQAVDAGVRGLHIGDKTYLEVSDCMTDFCTLCNT